MQVDEEYNPSGELDDRAARREYLQVVRAREADELRRKYMGSNQSIIHHAKLVDDNAQRQEKNKLHHETR